MSTRKKLVIIIDRSGSMGKEHRMNLAKDAALTVLNTLTPDDYVSIFFNFTLTKTVTQNMRRIVQVRGA